MVHLELDMENSLNYQPGTTFDPAGRSVCKKDNNCKNKQSKLALIITKIKRETYRNIVELFEQ